MNNATHEFALYFQELSESSDQSIIITEPTLLHRLQHVLRITVGDSLVFFDEVHQVVATVTAFSKKQVVATYEQLKPHSPVVPKIVVLMPLLKREALDEVVYSCQEFGVSGIVLVKTTKSSRSTLTDHEWERLERVRIAAAEQSKNFSFCSFLNQGTQIPSLSELVASSMFQKEYEQAVRLVAQPSGLFFHRLVPRCTASTSFVLTFGPEGDLTNEEQLLLDAHNFVSVTLGPTVLRAQEAAKLLVGLVRSSF